jgi:hypothetical protein
MKLTRIDHTPQGSSRISDWEWKLEAGDFTPPSPAGYFTSQKIPASNLMVMHHPAGYKDEWHHAPAPVWGTVLRGQVCIQTDDMEIRVLQPGDEFLACDLEVTIADSVRRMNFVEIPQDMSSVSP